MPFARLMTDLVEGHKARAKGQPVRPQQGFPPALESFQSPGWDETDDLWEYAGFPKVFEYLRGHVDLKIPDEWRAVIPRRL